MDDNLNNLLVGETPTREQLEGVPAPEARNQPEEYIRHDKLDVRFDESDDETEQNEEEKKGRGPDKAPRRKPGEAEVAKPEVKEEKAKQTTEQIAKNEDKAFKQERARRQAIEKEFAEFKRSVEAKLQPQQPAQQADVPDFDTNPLSALKYQNDQVVNKLNQFEQQNEQQRQRQYNEQVRNHTLQTYQQSAESFSESTPDFGEAYNYLAQNVIDELIENGAPSEDVFDHTGKLLVPSAARIALHAEEQQVQLAIQNGDNPAEKMYRLAQLRGYRATAAAPSQQQPSQKFETLQAGIKANQALPNGSKGATTGLTMDQFAGMSMGDMLKNAQSKDAGKLDKAWNAFSAQSKR